MAAGKVCTGFSKPYVALYNSAAGVITYSQGIILARGVSIELALETGSDNKFYADNVEAEVAGGTFSGGTATLTVDGLLEDARKLIQGLPAPVQITVGEKQVDVYNYGEIMRIPYVGIGFVVRYQSDGVVTYAPTILTKAKFQTPSLSAATQEAEIAWQTQTLVADLMRDDSADRLWKREAEDQGTEAEAEAVLKAMLGITEGGA